MSKTKAARLDAAANSYAKWYLVHFKEIKNELSAPYKSARAREQYAALMRPGVDATERALLGADPVELRLVELVYWQRSHTMEGAGGVVGLSKSAAHRRINKIIKNIAREMGMTR